MGSLSAILTGALEPLMNFMLGLDNIGNNFAGSIDGAMVDFTGSLAPTPTP